jgi:homocysteine S-methyltransferase
VTTLTQAIADGPVVLDGGLATQLEAQGHDLSSELWSARLLLDDPDAIVTAHRAFFEAGAQVAISASYQASFTGFARLGIGAAEGADLMRRSVDLAREAADVDGTPRWVAASVGPYGAALADGSEYTGDYDLDAAGLRQWHRPRLEVLAESGADVLALETIPCLAEAEALLTEVAGLGVPCWLSMTCAGGRTRAGEPVEEAYVMAREVPEVLAVGVNCTRAEEVAAVVDVAASVSELPVVVYPNSGEDWDAPHHTWTGQASYHPELVEGWIAAGARLVGGCCRVGPQQIAEIASCVRHRQDPTVL